MAYGNSVADLLICLFRGNYSDGVIWYGRLMVYIPPAVLYLLLRSCWYRLGLATNLAELEHHKSHGFQHLDQFRVCNMIM